jgi:cell wall-associated NlpC family hydrolase
LIKHLFVAAALMAAPEPSGVIRAGENIRQLLLGKAIVREAVRHIGQPYVWGGKDGLKDGGLDCSGFTATVYQAFGVRLPVSALEQYRGGIPIEKPALAPGDLVFFLTNGATPMHVGIYAGDGQFIHAPGVGKTIGRESINKGYFAVRYAGARRYPPPQPSTTQEKQP